MQLSMSTRGQRSFAAAPRVAARMGLRRVAVRAQPEASPSVPKLDVALCGQDEGCLIEHWSEAFDAAGNKKRKLIVGGNWKCNGSVQSVTELITGLNNAVKENPDFFNKVDVVVSPSMLHLAVAKNTLNPVIKVAAQNCHFGGNGAYTGEVSADQLVDFGIEWVVLGHSERRATPESGYGLMGNETSALVAKKVKYALSKGLKVIACIGETLQEREAGHTLDVCKAQLAPICASLDVDEWPRVVIAYEPVWAIGTGVSATKEDAQTVHAAIRGYLAVAVSPEVAATTRIQYGGSVSPDNCAALGKQPDIDGFLVGGASLKAASFRTIVEDPVSQYPNKFAV